MSATIQLGELSVEIFRKDIKNIHLSVHPPLGRVRIAAPRRISEDTLRVFAISKLSWIKRQRTRLKAQEREAPREFLERESHYLWGRRRLLAIRFDETKPSVSATHGKLLMKVRPGTSAEARARILHEWHKSLLHEAARPLILKWERRMNVTVNAYFIQRMRTKWGSCNHHAGHIRLNTELVKKPKRHLEYVIVHELAHMLEPSHGEKFVAILDRHFPLWREAREELNRLPLPA